MKVEESLNGVLDMTIRNTTFTGNTAGTEVRRFACMFAFDLCFERRFAHDLFLSTYKNCNITG